VVAWHREPVDRRIAPIRELDVQDILARARRARYIERATPGQGRVYGLAGAIQGLALIPDAGLCLHLHLTPGLRDRPVPEPPIIRPPRPPFPGPIVPYPGDPDR